MGRKDKEVEKMKVYEAIDVSWDRQLGESVARFALFNIYRNLGHTRSYRKVADLSCRNYNTITGIGWKNQWNKRATDYDAWQIEEMNTKLQEDILYSRLRQADLGKKLQKLGETGLDLLCKFPDELTPENIIRLADIGQKIERLALGDSTTIIKND